jgi:hypothetical protein
VTLRTFTVSVQGTPAGGFTPESGSGFELSGTVGDGNSVTITDAQSRFTSKTNVKPWLWCPFETDLQPHPTLSRTTSRTSPASVILQSSIKPTNAAGAARANAAAELGVTLFTNTPHFSLAGGRGYVFVKRYYAHGNPENLKKFRVWNTGNTQPNVFHGQRADSGDLMYIEATGWSAAASDTYGSQYLPINTWGQNVWQTSEYALDGPSTVDVYDAQIHQWHNGGLAKPYTNRWRTRTTSFQPTAVMTNGYFDQYTKNAGGIPDGGTYYLYYHSLYVDDSLHRVFVSDEASFNTALYAGTPINREICIPTSWSAGSVSFVLRQGSHSTLSGKYLYVVDGNGTPLKIGRFT